MDSNLEKELEKYDVIVASPITPTKNIKTKNNCLYINRDGKRQIARLIAIDDVSVKGLSQEDIESLPKIMPYVKQDDELSMLDFRDLFNFEGFVATYSEEWLQNPEEYENKLALPFSISPRELDEYWQNKDDVGDPIKPKEYTAEDGVSRKCISPTMRNSDGNRPPNWRFKTTRVEKIIYWLANIAYVRDYNLLPISMILNVKQKKQFFTLLAKDRGTFNFYHKKKDTKLTVKFWSRLLTELNETEYKDNVKIKAISGRITKLIATGKDFSMKEAVPGDVWTEWYNDKSYIHIRMKFETYVNHKNEMKRLNNSVNPWVEHNHIMADVITILPIDYPNTYKMETLDLIYKMVCGHTLFAGDEFLNVPNQKVEEFEGFLPWLFTSLDYMYKSDLETIQSILARGTVVNLGLKSAAYEKLFRDTCKVKKNGTASYTLFTDKTDLMVRISENDALKSFRKVHHTFCEKLGPKAKRHKNITDLTVSKWDTFMMVCHCISHIVREIHKNRGFNNERVDDITKLFFQEAENLLQNTNVISTLSSFTGGFQYRYEHFWKMVSDNVVDFKLKQQSGNFDVTLLHDVLVEDVETAGHVAGDKFEIYHRESSTQIGTFFPFHKDNNKPGEDGHLIPTEPLWYGNCVIQPSLDNKYNDNKPIRDIQAYIDELLIDIQNVKGDDMDVMILERTKVYYESWFNQKDYQIV